ncbi:MAG: hypothetical protein H7308_19530 [Chthonomonadaceae bacterium]|nr:hypothetical protein [Chthonomonadaceae bacterium]
MKFVPPDDLSSEKHSKAERLAHQQEVDEFWKAWREYEEKIRPLLSPALQRLHDTQVDDGLIRSLWIDPAQNMVKLCLCCGDLRVGYYDLDLTYYDVELTPQLITLLCLTAHHEHTEIQDDEVDIETGKAGTEPPAPIYIHRILWRTMIRTDRFPLKGTPAFLYNLEPEIELRFGSLDLEITPRKDRKFHKKKDFITVLHAWGENEEPILI